MRRVAGASIHHHSTTWLHGQSAYGSSVHAQRPLATPQWARLTRPSPARAPKKLCPARLRPRRGPARRRRPGGWAARAPKATRAPPARPRLPSTAPTPKATPIQETLPSKPASRSNSTRTNLRALQNELTRRLLTQSSHSRAPTRPLTDFLPQSKRLHGHPPPPRSPTCVHSHRPGCGLALNEPPPPQRPTNCVCMQCGSTALISQLAERLSVPAFHATNWSSPASLPFHPPVKSTSSQERRALGTGRAPQTLKTSAGCKRTTRHYIHGSKAAEGWRGAACHGAPARGLHLPNPIPPHGAGPFHRGAWPADGAVVAPRFASPQLRKL
jgi:hypothetical protein